MKAHSPPPLHCGRLGTSSACSPFIGEFPTLQDAEENRDTTNYAEGPQFSLAESGKFRECKKMSTRDQNDNMDCVTQIVRRARPVFPH